VAFTATAYMADHAGGSVLQPAIRWMMVITDSKRILTGLKVPFTIGGLFSELTHRNAMRDSVRAWMGNDHRA